MRFFTFEVVIEKRAGEEEYSAFSPGLHGCFARGPTIEEARHKVRAAIRGRVTALLASGETIDQPDALRYVEQLTVGVPGSGRARYSKRQETGMRGSGE